MRVPLQSRPRKGDSFLNSLRFDGVIGRASAVSRSHNINLGLILPFGRERLQFGWNYLVRCPALRIQQGNCTVEPKLDEHQVWASRVAWTPRAYLSCSVLRELYHAYFAIHRAP